VEFPPSFNLNEKQCLEILECSTILVDAQAPYGAIRKDTGRLVVKGRLLPVFHSTIEAKSLIEHSKDSLTFPMMNGSGGFGQCQMSRDALDPPPLVEGSGLDQVMMLEFLSDCGRSQWHCKGLVLRCVKGTVFSRIGVFDYYSGGNSRRTVENPESFDQWSARVDLEHNWFKYCIPRIIEII
jgi:hypothetical protein